MAKRDDITAATNMKLFNDVTALYREMHDNALRNMKDGLADAECNESIINIAEAAFNAGWTAAIEFRHCSDLIERDAHTAELERRLSSPSSY